MADAARARKVADRIHETVARLLGGRIKDPRLGFVTVTDVRVTGDLQQATVFYTVYGSQEERENSAKALRSATGLIRSEVGRALGIRLTPHHHLPARRPAHHGQDLRGRPGPGPGP